MASVSIFNYTNGQQELANTLKIYIANRDYEQLKPLDNKNGQYACLFQYNNWQIVKYTPENISFQADCILELCKLDNSLFVTPDAMLYEQDCIYYAINGKRIDTITDYIDRELGAAYDRLKDINAVYFPLAQSQFSWFLQSGAIRFLPCQVTTTQVLYQRYKLEHQQNKLTAKKYNIKIQNKTTIYKTKDNANTNDIATYILQSLSKPSQIIYQNISPSINAVNATPVSYCNTQSLDYIKKGIIILIIQRNCDLPLHDDVQYHIINSNGSAILCGDADYVEFDETLSHKQKEIKCDSITALLQNSDLLQQQRAVLIISSEKIQNYNIPVANLHKNSKPVDTNKYFASASSLQLVLSRNLPIDIVLVDDPQLGVNVLSKYLNIDKESRIIYIQKQQDAKNYQQAAFDILQL